MDIKNILKENKSEFLNTLYWYEENEGGIYSDNLKKIIKKVRKNREKRYKDIDKLLNELENDKLKLSILEAIDSYVETFRVEKEYSIEHYYKYGFKDSIKLIIEAYNYGENWNIYNYRLK